MMPSLASLWRRIPRSAIATIRNSRKGVAEDQARVLSLEESACVVYGCFDHLLQTKETSRLSPGVVEQKYYAEGVGFILGVMVKGGDERSELVRITTE